MADLKEYKCPACGAPMTFSSTLQKMKCDYCGTEMEVSALEALKKQKQEEGPDEMSWQNAGTEEWQDGETDGMKVYSCQSCGGEIMTDENTAATSCPFCGNPVVMMDRVSGSLRPNYVIPFKLDKKAAKEAYRNHLKGKILLPKMFRDENHIDEIKGVYVPFWIFDADVQASYRFHGTKTAVWDSGDYVYTRTSHYSIFRKGSLEFDHVPVDGDSKMADDLMEAIEPFDFSEAVDFETAYLAGYLADRYDVDADASIDRANDRIKESTEIAFRDSVVGYQSLTPEGKNVKLKNGTYKYALYPVWLLNTTWHDKKFVFAMNGQTGKMVGDLPADTRKSLLWQGGLTVVFSALALALLRVIL